MPLAYWCARFTTQRSRFVLPPPEPQHWSQLARLPAYCAGVMTQFKRIRKRARSALVRHRGREEPIGLGGGTLGTHRAECAHVRFELALVLVRHALLVRKLLKVLLLHLHPLDRLLRALHRGVLGRLQKLHLVANIHPCLRTPETHTRVHVEKHNP